MAAFNDALDLKTAVGDFIGNRVVSDVWPRLVQMAETQLNQRLRTVWQETVATLTFASGEAALPADCLEIIDLYGTNGYRMRSSLRSDSRVPGTSYSRYSIGSGKIYIRGYSGDRDILYYASLPTISGSLSDTNWLLDKFGDVYLYGVAFQAAKHLKDVELAATADQLFGSALQTVKIEDERMRWANAVVRVQGQTP